MLQYYNHVLWFKVCRPARYKYKLSVNSLLCLVGAYCYSQAINKPFTGTNLLRFIPFFNDKRMKYYIRVLIDRGYLVQVDSYNKYLRYSISLAGIIT